MSHASSFRRRLPSGSLSMPRLNSPTVSTLRYRLSSSVSPIHVSNPALGCGLITSEMALVSSRYFTNQSREVLHPVVPTIDSHHATATSEKTLPNSPVFSSFVVSMLCNPLRTFLHCSLQDLAKSSLRLCHAPIPFGHVTSRSFEPIIVILVILRKSAFYVMCAPCVSTYTVYSDWLAAMNNRFRFFPPKHRFAQISGSKIIPIRSPLGAKMCTPSYPGPTHPAPTHKFPSTSARIPSANPAPFPANSIEIAVFPFFNFFPSTKSNPFTIFGASG